MKVLITREIPQVGINLLKNHPEIELDYRQGPPLSTAEMADAIKDADAIIPVIPDKITAELIGHATKLKVIATYSVGYDHIDIQAATTKKIYVGNTPGDLTESVAEHTIALMFAVGKRICEGDRYCRQGNYNYWEPMLFIGPRFMDKTIGIIGFGRIGQMVARIAKMGLNMQVVYADPMKHPEAEGLLDAKKVEIEELLSMSDVVSLNCNLTPDTHHLLNEESFKLMKPLAYVLNTARGPVIDEQALVNALKNHWIAGAGLDVFENEPEIHPELKTLDNVVLTPHTASATLEARIQMSKMACENVLDVLVNNKAPRYLVNKELLEQNVNSIA